MYNKTNTTAVLLAIILSGACKKHDAAPKAHILQPDISSVDLEWTAGSKDSVKVRTDVAFEVSVPDDAKDWLSVYQPDTTGTIVLNALSSDSAADRMTEITLKIPGDNLTAPVKLKVRQRSVLLHYAIPGEAAGPNGGSLRSVVSLKDGSFVLMGVTSSPAAGTTQSHGRTDIYVTKIDASGKKIWSKLYGGAGNEWPSQMIATSDGGFAITGTTQSIDGDFSGAVQPAATFNPVLFILKLHGDGTRQFAQFYGSSSPDDNVRIAETKSGSIILAGLTHRLDGQLPPTTQSVTVGSAFFLLATDANGRYSWYQLYGGVLDEAPAVRSLVLADNGDIVFTGEYYGTADHTFAGGRARGGYDLFIIRTNASGVVKTAQLFGSSGDDRGLAATATSNGDLLLAGTIARHDGDFASYSSFSNDNNLVVMSASATGELTIRNVYPLLTYRFAPASIAQMPDGGLLIGGYGDNASAGIFANTGYHGGNDMFLLRFKPDASLQWVHRFGSAGDEYLSGLAVGPDGTIMLAGSTQSATEDMATITTMEYPLSITVKEN